MVVYMYVFLQITSNYYKQFSGVKVMVKVIVPGKSFKPNNILAMYLFKTLCPLFVLLRDRKLYYSVNNEGAAF